MFYLFTYFFLFFFLTLLFFLLFLFLFLFLSRGFVVSVVRDLGLPVKFIGVGEKVDDLRDFEPVMFVDALLGNNEETSAKMKARVNKMLNLEPLKALNNAMTDGNPRSGSADTSDRLRASFGQSNGREMNDNNDEEEEVEKGSDKPKRAKRPKPQSAKPKKSKK